MDFLSAPINQAAQLQQIIDDTDLIIKKFKEKSETIPEDIMNNFKIKSGDYPDVIENRFRTMNNLGRIILNSKEESTSAGVLGEGNINNKQDLGNYSTLGDSEVKGIF